jgi:hypothetical protein
MQWCCVVQLLNSKHQTYYNSVSQHHIYLHKTTLYTGTHYVTSSEANLVPKQPTKYINTYTHLLLLLLLSSVYRCSAARYHLTGCVAVSCCSALLRARARACSTPARQLGRALHRTSQPQSSASIAGSCTVVSTVAA